MILLSNLLLVLKISMNALTRSKLDDVTMNWDNYRLIDHNYSNVIKIKCLRLLIKKQVEDVGVLLL